MSPSSQKPWRELGLWQELRTWLLIPQTLGLWAVSALGPSLTGLPGEEEVETDPSQTVTTQVVRAIGERSLRGSGFPEETPNPVKDTRRMGSLVKRLSKGED